jgi:hypothetical protein
MGIDDVLPMKYHWQSQWHTARLRLVQDLLESREIGILLNSRSRPLARLSK